MASEAVNYEQFAIVQPHSAADISLVIIESCEFKD